MPFNVAIMSEGFRQIFNTHKRSVTLNRVTKTTSNVTGSEIKSFEDSTVDIVFFKTGEDNKIKMEGIVEVGDALFFDKPDNLSLQRDDKITVDGDTYVIKHTPRQWKASDTEPVYDMAVGYLVA